MTIMEAQEEIMMKKKRTKRPRPASPLSLTMATSSCTTVDGTNDYVDASPSSSGGLIEQTTQDHEAEQDMAKCLILLAHGRHKRKSSQEQSILAAVTHKTATGASNEVYQCKTCNRCFHSFQALSGHRASHKKPKPTQEDHQPKVQEHVETTTKLSLQISSGNLCNPSNNISKLMRVHECSTCGAEFNSGQALGGHMRRHRPIPMVNLQEVSPHQDQVKKSRPLLSLDLNLPAPEDNDDHLMMESKFPFAAKEQVIVFSTSPLVDCHY